MSISKKLLTLSIIGLLIGITTLSVSANDVSPISTAETKYVIYDEEGLQRDAITLTSEQEAELEAEITTLMNSAESTQDSIDLIQLLRDLVSDSDDSSILQDILDNSGEFTLNPFGKRVFILSFGRNNILNPLRNFQINLFRPSTVFWYYSGTSERIITDKTLIIDPYPLNIKMIDGRQIGMMKRFMGIYIYKPTTQSSESFTFFIGYAVKALGLDLSP